MTKSRLFCHFCHFGSKIVFYKGFRELQNKIQVIYFMHNPIILIKSFCRGPGGGFFKKSPLAAGGKKIRTY
jgi:hypothetical protein